MTNPETTSRAGKDLSDDLSPAQELKAALGGFLQRRFRQIAKTGRPHEQA
jgi:hypothetical protein